MMAGIRCSGGWGLWCWWVRHLAPEPFVREQLPTILARDSTTRCEFRQPGKIFEILLVVVVIIYTPVVPHKAVAEVSKIGNL